MKKDLYTRILASYEMHDDDDISTEQLLQRVADDCSCDVDTVIFALSMADGDNEH